jgi:VWFA-related protein
MQRTLMRVVVLFAAHLLAAPFAAQAQSSGQPAPPAASNRAKPQQPEASGLTLHARSDLVVIDVVVSDAKQGPVHHLKASDFTLLEDKVPQQINSFEEHSAPVVSARARQPAMPVMPPGIFTNYSPAPANGTVNVLLLDALNTPMNAQTYVRQQLLEYLKNAPAGTPIAIFGLTDRLTILQGFTSDPAMLKAAVSKATAQGSSLLDDPLTGAPGQSTTDFMGPPGGIAADPVASQMMANVQQFEAVQASYQLQRRAQLTLEAMDQLARYLVGIPGRKNLIWFSGSFPLSVLPNGDLTDPFAVIASAEDEYRETTNALARSQVAVYPIDARGIVTSTVHAASSPTKNYARNPHSFAKDEAGFYQELYAEHDTMNQMAQDTGGCAFVDTNGLTEAVAKAIESGSNYYTLSYAPSNTKWNGKYRRIEVKLPRPGLKLSYRHGYFSDDPNATPKRGVEVSAATAPEHESPMNMALMRGGPGATEMLFKVRVLPANATAEDTVAAGNRLNPDPNAAGNHSLKEALKGPFRRYVLDFVADPGAVTFTRTANGNYQCAVEFVTFVYDRDGGLIATTGKTVRSDLTPPEYLATIRSAVPFHQEVSVPVKGEYYLRSAVHDLGSDRVGAVEVPVASVAGLTPLSAGGGAAATPGAGVAPR